VNRKAVDCIFELYNLIDDPDESNNIVQNKPDIFKDLFKQINNIRNENKIRFKKNLKKIKKEVNLGHELNKTIETLKSLGYI
jgi:hypothetical protein